jgi:hypothetical protein
MPAIISNISNHLVSQELLVKGNIIEKNEAVRRLLLLLYLFLLFVYQFLNQIELQLTVYETRRNALSI